MLNQSRSTSLGDWKNIQRVVRGLGRRQSTAVGQEGCDLSTSFVNLCNRLDSIEMVDPRIETYLIHNCDACLFDFLF